MSPLEKRLFRSFSHFLIGLFVSLALTCMSCLYILKLTFCQLFHLLLFSPILRVVFSLYSFLYLQGSNGETVIANRLMDMGQGEESVRYMERVTWKLTLPYIKQIASGNLPHGSGNSNRGSVSI